MQLIKINFIILLLCCCQIIYAKATPLYQFPKQRQQQQFDRLTHELRCLVCQNQNLADSQAKLAFDLRKQIYTMILRGDSDQKIKNFMVARYGNFVLYKPALNDTTWLLWFAPFILLVVGLLLLRKIR